MSPLLSRDAPAASLTNRRDAWLCAIFIVVFVLHALNYPYFFVDDEAIPFVYAQNVLDGHGLVYNPDDGPVEGYSDFLSVWIDTGILAFIASLGAGKLSALLLAKLFAFAFAIALVVVTFDVLRRMAGPTRVPLIAGMSFLTLAGPLAVWSWSALETTLFAFIVALIVKNLLESDRSRRRNDWSLLGVVVAALLCRVDGFVWAGALVAPFLVSRTKERRWELVTRVILPALGVFAAYHGWRVWYFGELLPMPVYAKVLYKLLPQDRIISNDPSERYVIAFLRAYGWIPIAVVGLNLLGGRRLPQVRSLALAILLVLAYLWVVGDWMFGFRFFVPLLAPMAILAAATFVEVTRWKPRAAAAAFVVWTAALAVIAYQFERAYEREQGRQSWFAAPSLEPARFFDPYYQIYEQARNYVGPGDTIAYNQAGFVPFMLGAHNVDDLGICTKFYAKLPTTDVIFTEVGRYSPLTGRRALRASDAYTLARAPRVLLAPGGNVRSANNGHVPGLVLGGAYQLLFSSETVAAYSPAGVPLDRYRTDSHLYLENLVHISHLQRVWLNSRVLSPEEYRSALPYVYGGEARLTFEHEYLADLTFSKSDESVSQLHIESIVSAEPATLVLLLNNAVGRQVYRDSFDLRAAQRRDVHVDLGDEVRAAALSLALFADSSHTQTVDLVDLSVQGQTTRLRRFLSKSDGLK